MLIAKCVHCPDFVPIADGKLDSGLITWIQMRILDTVFRFQTHPLNIVCLGHWVLLGTDGYMNGIPFHLIYRNMLFPGCLCCTRKQFLHFFAAAVNWNTFVSDHSRNISTVFAYHKFLFHILPPYQKCVQKKIYNTQMFRVYYGKRM